MLLKVETSKGETVYINPRKILFFYEHKDKTRIEMEDGTVFDVKQIQTVSLDDFVTFCFKN